MANEAEPDRKADKERRQKEIKALRREEKMKKRALNIEIASEVVDLVMDVANEAFDFQVQA